MWMTYNKKVFAYNVKHRNCVKFYAKGEWECVFKGKRPQHIRALICEVCPKITDDAKTSSQTFFFILIKAYFASASIFECTLPQQGFEQQERQERLIELTKGTESGFTSMSAIAFASFILWKISLPNSKFPLVIYASKNTYPYTSIYAPTVTFK